MGENAEMILEGFLDEETGEVLDGTAPGYPRRMSNMPGPSKSEPPARKNLRVDHLPRVIPGCSAMFSTRGGYPAFAAHHKAKHAPKPKIDKPIQPTFWCAEGEIWDVSDDPAHAMQSAGPWEIVKIQGLAVVSTGYRAIISFVDCDGEPTGDEIKVFATLAEVQAYVAEMQATTPILPEES